MILADDLIDTGMNCVLGQMLSVFNDRNCSILGVEEVPHDETDKYGIVDPEESDGRITKLKSIVEKPTPADARSNLAVVGRYVLNPGIFGTSEHTAWRRRRNTADRRHPVPVAGRGGTRVPL